jgi:hypothetical protein
MSIYCRNSECVELYLHSPIPHGPVIKHRASFIHTHDGNMSPPSFISIQTISFLPYWNSQDNLANIAVAWRKYRQCLLLLNWGAGWCTPQNTKSSVHCAVHIWWCVYVKGLTKGVALSTGNSKDNNHSWNYRVFELHGPEQSQFWKPNSHLPKSICSPTFIEPEGSLSHSQEPDIGLYPEPEESNLNPLTQFLISILILFSHLCLNLLSGLIHSD